MHLDFVNDVWHGWQMSCAIIYLVYMTNPQIFVGFSGMCTCEACPLHFQHIQWCSRVFIQCFGMKLLGTCTVVSTP